MSMQAGFVFGNKCFTAVPAISRFLPLIFVAFLSVALIGCDQKRMDELEETVSTEGDVRLKFGEPENIWEGPDGAKVLEYNRQPEGDQNFMITIGTDGKMAALRQVLTPANFATITPGMAMEDVRKLLGKPMKLTPYELKREIHYDWRYRDGPNATDRKIFTVVFDPDFRVINTESRPDPANLDLEQTRR
jgi:SmpA / OmlA family